MQPQLIYLHGFASGPDSQKGQLLAETAAEHGIDCQRPDLNGDDFTALSMDSWLQRARDAINAVDESTPLVLAGSSLGAYTAALLAAEIQRSAPLQLYLLAPAFGFVHQWPQLLGGDAALVAWREKGVIPVEHHQYQQTLDLGYAFYESCQSLPSLPPPTRHPGVLLYGRHDEVIDQQQVQAYAAQNQQIKFIALDDDHALLRDKSCREMVARFGDLL